MKKEEIKNELTKTETNEEKKKTKGTKKKKIKDILLTCGIILLIIVIFEFTNYVTKEENNLTDKYSEKDNNIEEKSNPEKPKNENSNSNDRKTEPYTETINEFSETLINVDKELQYASKQNYTKENSEYFYIENGQVYYKLLAPAGETLYKFNMENETPKYIITASTCGESNYIVQTEKGNVYAINMYGTSNDWTKINIDPVDDVIVKSTLRIVQTCRLETIYAKINDKYYILADASDIYYHSQTEINYLELRSGTNGMFDINSHMSKYTLEGYCIWYKTNSEDRTLYENLLKEPLLVNGEELIVNSYFDTTDKYIIIDTKGNVIVANKKGSDYDCAKLLEISEIKKSKVKSITINGTVDEYSYYGIDSFTITYADDTTETYSSKSAYTREKNYTK